MFLLSKHTLYLTQNPPVCCEVQVGNIQVHSFLNRPLVRISMSLLGAHQIQLTVEDVAAMLSNMLMCTRSCEIVIFSYISIY